MSTRPSLFFVHGTGVRQASLDRTVERLTAGVEKAASGTAITVCNWGESVGSTMRLGGASVPAVSGGRAVPGEDAAWDDEVAEWADLELDPLVELRLEAAADRGGELPPGVAGPHAQLSSYLRRIAGDPGVASAAAAAGVADDLSGALRDVLTSPEAARAAGAAEPEDRVVLLLSRAVVASALAAADERIGGVQPVHGDSRDVLVRAVAAACGYSQRGPIGGLGRAAGRFAWSVVAARPVERRRRALTDAASPLAGDVMRYLAAGQLMRDFVADAVRSVDGPVVLLGHSLGGMICLETLHQTPLPGVVGLVTVGSQAGFLHELGALPVIGSATVPGFDGPWRNIYDPRDLLAFLAEPVFGDRVTDYAVDNRSPFPRSHSAYFDNAAVYRLVAEMLEAGTAA